MSTTDADIDLLRKSTGGRKLQLTPMAKPFDPLVVEKAQFLNKVIIEGDLLGNDLLIAKEKLIDLIKSF